MFRVISGGQTGTDRAALDAAFKLGFETGGFAPKGWRTTAGPAPELAAFGMVESQSAGYGLRTEQNVMAAQATILISVKPNSPGSKLTIETAAAFHKPYKIVEVFPQGGAVTYSYHAADLAVWLVATSIEILNVAGNSEKSWEGMYQLAYPYMIDLLEAYLVELNG